MMRAVLSCSNTESDSPQKGAVVADKDKRLKRLEKRSKELESRLDKLEKSLKKRKKRCHKKGRAGTPQESHHGKASKSAAHAKCDRHGHGDKKARNAKGADGKSAGNTGKHSTRSTARTRKPASGGDVPESAGSTGSDA
jgi:hypothetical protein